jgi:hypothetical protein
MEEIIGTPPDEERYRMKASELVGIVLIIYDEFIFRREQR